MVGFASIIAVVVNWKSFFTLLCLCGFKTLWEHMDNLHKERVQLTDKLFPDTHMVDVEHDYYHIHKICHK